jgi:hypothetical protein
MQEPIRKETERREKKNQNCYSKIAMCRGE